jgi:hypothetical protein
VPILNLQHLAETARGLKRANDAVAHLRAGECVLDAIQLVGGFQQLSLFVRRNPPIAFRLDLCFDLDAESVER